MTNDDELLKRLDKGVLRHKDGFVKFNQACRDMEEAAARIRELEAELEFYRGFHDGVCKTGTHQEGDNG